MTERELEIENLELRLEIGLLNREKLYLLREIDDIRRETGLKDPKEYHYKSRKQELKKFLVKKLDTRIVDFNISIRVLNVLKSLNCDTLRDVIKLTPKEIFETRNCGKKTLADIIEFLRDEGLELGMDESKFFEKKK